MPNSQPAGPRLSNPIWSSSLIKRRKKRPSTGSARPVLRCAFFFLALGHTTAAPAAVAPGTYDGSQAELAARLLLQPDGRFRYALSYGALDEQAQGKWIEDGGRVLLTTEPAPKPPRFAVVSDTATPDGSIQVALDDPELLQGSSITMVVHYAGAAERAYLEADENGRLSIPAGKTITALVPDLPVFPVPLKPYTLKPGGHRIVFRFEPNDIGTAGFRAEPLAIEGGALVLKRYDRTIRFEKAAD